MNRLTFDFGKEGSRKHFNSWLELLLKYNLDVDNDTYYDIHIDNDGNSIILEWEEKPFDSSEEWGGSFTWVDSYDEVYTEVHFPDDHYEMVPVRSKNEVLKEWHKDHPEWVMTSYGTWTDSIQNATWQIENNLGKWLSQEDLESNKIVKYKHIKAEIGDTLTKNLRKMDDDVLRRTDYIVVGGKLLDSCKNDLYLKYNKNFEGSGDRFVGSIYLPLKIQEPWKDNPDFIEKNINVFFDCHYDCEDKILFVVDNGTLIGVEDFKSK